MPSPRQQATTFGRQRREQTSSTGVREHGEHETAIHSVPGRPGILSKEYFSHKEHFIQGERNGMQGVGFVHSTKEAGNNGGGKGRTYKPFLGQNIGHTGGGKEDGKCVRKNSAAGRETQESADADALCEQAKPD